jgi:hypothetical protein
VVEQSLVELAVLPERPLSGRPTNGDPKFPVYVYGFVILPICLFVVVGFIPLILGFQNTYDTIQEPSTIAWTLMGVAILFPIAINFLLCRCFEPNTEKRLDKFNGDGAVVGDFDFHEIATPNKNIM